MSCPPHPTPPCPAHPTRPPGRPPTRPCTHLCTHPGFDVVAAGKRLRGEPQHAHQEPELGKVGLDVLLHGAVLLALVWPVRLVHKLDLEGQAGQPATIRALPLLVGPPKPVGADHQHAVELEDVLALELPRRGQVVAPADPTQHGAGQGLFSSTNASLHPSRFASCSRGFSVFWTINASCVMTATYPRWLRR